ncbi:CLUMA_CG001276, isoform A [Clunio marinus]|uniref:CLUMA_CG001276, isoform A n=1 Tax=Clunio marinus TaxID=568069 RepID=A0A1J1HHV3_9DIPT|nr:CLUMA_CG001276, isoform A [Clunio marinus]
MNELTRNVEGVIEAKSKQLITFDQNIFLDEKKNAKHRTKRIQSKVRADEMIKHVFLPSVQSDCVTLCLVASDQLRLMVNNNNKHLTYQKTVETDKTSESRESLSLKADRLQIKI